MAEQNLSAMTVIELRKLAKELHVPLSAGISKQGIVDRLTQAIGSASEEAPAPAPAEAKPEAPAQEPQPADEEKPVDVGKPDEPVKSAEPAKPADSTPASGFRQAYTAPRFNAKPAYQAPAYSSRPGSRPPAPIDSPRPTATRPTGFTPRFGPAAQENAPASREEERPYRAEPQRPAYSAERRPAYGENPRYQLRPPYEQRPAAEQPARPAYESRPAAEPPARPAYEQRSAASGANPAVSEMLSAGECLDGSGVLELHPDGYGFLRSPSLLPSVRDIYVSAAQVRRFGLRTGDRITGKNRPLRDGDKYSAMLYINTVNDAPANGLISRPAFEELTAEYPTRRIRLETEGGDLRLMDLLTPIGFGQRALLHCPSENSKRRLLVQLANAITRNHPDAAVMLVLFGETPEDVTLLRDQVKCPVLATTFDMPPENHIRLADMSVEYAQRMVESKRDVVLLADSLTTLSKVCTTAALQQGRQTLGSVSPTSLQKAKRLFGAARSLREGGSLTVIAAMNTETGSKVDEAIASEFRGTANMELAMSSTVRAENVFPPIDLLRSGTKRTSALISPEHAECLSALRSLLNDLTPDAALGEIASMLDKTADNAELFSRIKDWAAAMRK